MMKKYLSILGVFCFFSSAFAQEITPGSGYAVASGFAVTKPLREMPDMPEVNTEKEERESEDRKHRKAQRFKFTGEDGALYQNEEASIQREMGTVDAGHLRVSFAGQSSGGARPFDPSGAVGPNHYVQMINATTFKVYNKTSGAALYTHSLGSLWSPATSNDGDPIVMYDKAADRWFLAQFGLNNNEIFIAISTTGDPSGSYYTYTFTSTQFPDYLKFSVWQDGYYMTANVNNQRVFAFERDAMISGIPGARVVYASFSPPDGGGFFCPLTGCVSDGALPPAGTPCPIFSYSDNGWGGSNQDRVNIYKMTVNWTPTTPTASITAANNVTTAAFDASYNSSWNDVSQPNTTQKLDGIGGVCMYRAQYKIWEGYNSVVLNWAVKISTSQRSIKWCELRQDQTTGTWSMYQEGIFTPDAATRWMGSILMDDNGSIGLSYMKSDATSIFPGLYFTGRRTCDPLGTLPITETLIVAGTGSQTGMNRTGDYAHGTLDMDGITFWSTSEYMGGSTGGSAAKTRIFSYQIESCMAAAISIALSGGSQPICQGEVVTLVASPEFGGTAPQYEWFVNGTSIGNNNDTLLLSNAMNGDVVTCTMISNEPGLEGASASSEEVALAIVGSVVPTVSISTAQQVVCEGAQAQFVASTLYAGSTPTYQWYADGVAIGSNNDTLNYTINSAQNISCMVTSSVSCASPNEVTSAVLTITPQPIVTPEVTISASNDTITAGQSVTFTASSTNAGTTPVYHWYVNGILINSAGTSATFTTSTLGNGQTVTCQLAGNIPCSSVQNVTSNGITMVVQQPSSVEEWDSSIEMLIYPNPSMGEVTFKARHSGTFYIVSEAGQLVREVRLNKTNNLQVTLNDLASGMYIVVGQNEYGIVRERLIVVK